MTRDKNSKNPKGVNVLSVVMSILLALFFIVACDSPAKVFPESSKVHNSKKHIPKVSSYNELRESPMYRQVKSWVEDQERLKKNTPGYSDEVNFDGTNKEDVLSKRKLNRAFDGAPPTVPHPIIQTGSPDCLVCHKEGLKIHGRTASKISHKMMTNCTQCHTTKERQDPVLEPYVLSEDNIPRENSFEGMTSPTEGKRSFAIGPPGIPHKIFMRENCDSCHGLNGKQAIRTSHPSRQNCQQCHVRQADNGLKVSPNLLPMIQ